MIGNCLQTMFAANSPIDMTKNQNRKAIRKRRRVFAKHRPSDGRLRCVVHRRIDKDGGWRRRRPEKEKMTPLSCAKPSLKMRRLFYCEKCLLFVCYLFAIALKNGEKKTAAKALLEAKNFSPSKNGRGSCLLLFAITPEKGSFWAP